MEPDIAIGLIYYAMERNFPTSPANQEIREALTIKNVSIPGSTTLEWNVLERSVLQRYREMTFVAMGDQQELKLERR